MNDWDVRDITNTQIFHKDVQQLITADLKSIASYTNSNLNERSRLFHIFKLNCIAFPIVKVV